jgi:hypothetical protein
MSEKLITKNEENSNVIHNKKLYEAFVKTIEKSQEIKKWVFEKSKRNLIASRLEWFMLDKAQRDAFLSAEELLKNVNNDDQLETLLLKKVRELDEQFEKEYDILKNEAKEIFENYELSEEDIKNVLTFVYYEYYIERYIYTLARAYIILHDLPYSTLEKFNFKKISDTRTGKEITSRLEFFSPEIK